MPKHKHSSTSCHISECSHPLSQSNQYIVSYQIHISHTSFVIFHSQSYKQ
ncbi:hypothetical protein F383_05842 [Gossypium arboreum]|uniref:Uncharacterized protein n=1 Tax=Gossypium arboreum TaxID=29729 RepID=A0A0B0PFJ1_GOSAR|nr:hypothetical protein F383_05842 [Gossypium arboreum]